MSRIFALSLYMYNDMKNKLTYKQIFLVSLTSSTLILFGV